MIMNSSFVYPADISSLKERSSDSSGEKIFQLALVFSILLHSLMLVVLFAVHIEKKNTLTKIREIVYRKQDKAVVVKRPAGVPQVHRLEERVTTTAPKILTEKAPFQTAAFDKAAKTPSRLLEHQKLPSALPELSAKRRISVPVLQSEKMASPRYLNYNDRIRAKIQSRAASYVDDKNFREGEVYLTFVVLANGALKDIQVIDDKTRATVFLKDVGLRSIRESSPFPPFPEDLKYPELSFNVIISFQVEK
jgi:outer membrane biosynthesis protein TonB